MNILNPTSAKALLDEKIHNINLKRHCWAVGIVMGAYYDYFKNAGKDMQDTTKEDWATLGYIHDSDYEITKDDWSKHTLLLMEWLENYEIKPEILNAVKSHNSKITMLRNPQTLMEWTLECCDELTGFIVACALIQPTKKINDVTVESVIGKFKKKEFARAVDRNQITQCSAVLGIDVNTFVKISLEEMQKNSETLGL